MEVSNPYNIENIDKDYNSYSEIIINLPENETILKSGNAWTPAFTLTIPSGVKVVKLYDTGYGDMWIRNLDNNIYWNQFSGWEATTYIGVTPLKSYRLQYEGYDVGNFSISYSKSINEIIPDGTDY